MNTLNRSNIIITWVLGYVGVAKNWLSPDDVVKSISSKDIDKLNEDKLSEFYVSADTSKEAFLEFLELIGNISDKLFKEGLWVWSIAYLNDISSSNKTISEKLRDIANVWAMVDYPEDWKEFIYYMPAFKDEDSGEDKIYKKFERYLTQQNNKLKELGYLN